MAVRFGADDSFDVPPTAPGARAGATGVTSIPAVKCETVEVSTLCRSLDGLYGRGPAGRYEGSADQPMPYFLIFAWSPVLDIPRSSAARCLFHALLLSASRMRVFSSVSTSSLRER